MRQEVAQLRHSQVPRLEAKRMKFSIVIMEDDAINITITTNTKVTAIFAIM
jgi:hypothetical protein